MELFKNTIKQAIEKYDFTNQIEHYDQKIFELSIGDMPMEILNESVGNDTLILELIFDFRGEIEGDDVRVCEDLYLRAVSLFLFNNGEELKFDTDLFYDDVKDSLIQSMNDFVMWQ